MSFRADIAKTATAKGEPGCSCSHAVEQKHLDEAKEKGFEKKEDQIGWLLDEALIGVKQGCKCAQGVQDVSFANNTISGACNSDPNALGPHVHGDISDI